MSLRHIYYYIKDKKVSRHNWASLAILKDQPSHLVYLNNRSVKNLPQNWSSTLRDNNERKNTNVTRSCVLSCLISEPQNLNRRSRNQIPEKTTSFSKTTLLQRERFLTMFYTINSSPLLVTK